MPDGSKAVMAALRGRPWPETEIGAILSVTARELLAAPALR